MGRGIGLDILVLEKKEVVEECMGFVERLLPFFGWLFQRGTRRVLFPSLLGRFLCDSLLGRLEDW